MDEPRKVDDYVSNTARVSLPYLLKERKGILGGEPGEIEAILAIEYFAGFAVNRLIGAEQARCEILLPAMRRIYGFFT